MLAWVIPLGILGARTVGGDNDGTDGVAATKKAIFRGYLGTSAKARSTSGVTLDSYLPLCLGLSAKRYKTIYLIVY